MVRQITKELVNLPALNTILESDLDKAFRSDIFVKKEQIDESELAIAIFKQASERDRRKSISTRKQSIKTTSIIPEHQNWKSHVPEATLEWLQGKVVNAKDSELKADSESMDNYEEENVGKRYNFLSLLLVQNYQ